MSRSIVLELSAVIVGLNDQGDGPVPQVLTKSGPDLPMLAFDPEQHKTLERGLRDWVQSAFGLSLGFVEQLYTFGDRQALPGHAHPVSVGYLAISRPGAGQPNGLDWTDWSRFLPWESRIESVPAVIPERIAPALQEWAQDVPQRQERAALSFGFSGNPWRDELVLERYELLYEAGLVAEALRDRGESGVPLAGMGQAMPLDHRRILATGIGRLRAKLKYRPVLFELMPSTFTLLDLQKTAEAVSGVPLHKQNFRRMVEKSGLIEPTGRMSQRHSGRPATEYRIASEAEWERRVAPVRFGGARRVDGGG